MLAMLLAYDALGNVVATLDVMVARDDAGNVTGLVDFAAHEAEGGEHTDIWQVGSAAGSKVWPEFLGERGHEFRVELVGPPGAKRIGALIHKASGVRRERTDVEAAIAARVAETPEGQPIDLRDIVGGPTRPIGLDPAGRTATPRPRARSQLPLVARG